VPSKITVQAYCASEDLEGGVTYYFDARNNTTQIMIRAKTDDFRPLVDWLNKYYGSLVSAPSFPLFQSFFLLGEWWCIPFVRRVESHHFSSGTLPCIRSRHEVRTDILRRIHGGDEVP
jgi:hypothetical protein